MRTSRRKGITLVELMTSIVIIAVVASLVMPVIVSAADSYYYSVTARSATERGSYAMERMVRLLRDCPAGATSGTAGIATATAQSIRFTDGRGLDFASGTITLRDASGNTGALLDNVTSFTIGYLGNDGVTSTLATPTTTQRFNITVVAGGLELRGSAFARIGILSP